MKYILSSLLILVVGCSYGQIDTAKFYPLHDYRVVGDYEKFDTIKIIMLYSDTAYSGNGYYIGQETGSGFRLHNQDVHCYWQYGYEVRKDTFVAAHEEHGTNEGFDRMPYTLIVPDKTYNILVERLDADKKPLPKSIVIWQTINIK